MRRLNVLVGCEESQAVAIEFNKLGHRAFSCDLLPCSGGHPEWHIRANISDVINGKYFIAQDGSEHLVSKWDMLIAFPPCTHLAVSGAKHFEAKRKDGRQQKGIDFFMQFTNVCCDYIAIENPVGIMSTKWRKPDQIIQPYQFGHPSRKTTCLWLKGLPKLKQTEIVKPNIITLLNGKTFSEDYMKGVKRSKAGDSSTARSKTYKGIAKAMAEQWSDYILNKIRV